MHTTHPLCSKPPFPYGAHGFLKHVKTRECQAVHSSQSWVKPQIRRPARAMGFAARPGRARPIQFPARPTSEIRKPPARPGSWAGGGDQILRDGLRWMLKKGLLGRNFSGRPMGRWVGPALAVVVTGVVFGAIHAEGLQFYGLALVGVVLSFLAYRTGRLGMSMLTHASFNLVAVLTIAHWL